MILAVKQYKWLLLLAVVVGLAFLSFQALTVEAQTPTNGLSGYAWSSNFGYIKMSGTTVGGNAYGVRADVNGVLSGLAWVAATDPDATPADTDAVGWLSFNSGDLGGCPSGTCQAKLDPATGRVSGWARFLRGNQIDGDGWVKLSGNTTGGSAYGVQVSGCQWSGYAYSGGNDDRGAGWISFRPTTGTVAYGVQGNGNACVAGFAYDINAESPVTVVRPSSGTINEPVQITITKTAGTTNSPVSVTGVLNLPTGVLVDYSTAQCTPATGAPCQTNIILRVPSGGNVTQDVTVQTMSATGIPDSDTFSLVLQAPVVTAFQFDVTANPTSRIFNAAGRQDSTITVTRTLGTAATVNLSPTIASVSGGPTTGVSASLAQPSCVPNSAANNCQVTLNIDVANTAAQGQYRVTVRGTNGSYSDTADVMVCVNFCSSFTYRVDAPTNRITVNRSSTVAVTRTIPIDITKLSSGAGESVAITRITGFPAGVSTTTTALTPCIPGATPCRISVPIRVTAGATSIAPFTATVYTRSTNGVPGSDTFLMEAVYVSPTIDFTVDPADVTINRYGFPTPSTVLMTWTGTAPRESIGISDVEFDDATANVGTTAIYGGTCNTATNNPCPRPLSLSVSPNVKDGTYSGTVRGRSTSGAVEWGVINMTVAVGLPVVDLTGKETGSTGSMDNGPVIVATNGTADLQWISSDAENCQLSSGGMNLGIPGPAGTFTTGSITTRTTFTISCTNANTVTPVRDTIIVDVGAPAVTPVATLQVSRACGTSGSCSWENDAITIPYGSNIDFRWNATNATGCNLIRRWNGISRASGVTAPPAWMYDRGVGPMTQTRIYDLVCTNGSGGEGRDTVTVNISSSVDITGPGGCTNCTADQNEKVTIGWNYDGPITDQCQLVDSSGNVILVGGSGRFDPDEETETEVTLPSNRSNVSYTLNCPGGLTDTVNFTLNVVQCFDNLTYQGATRPTAAFILQDTNSQNTFTLDGKIDLFGFNPANLRLRFADEACTDMGVINQCSSTRRVDVNILNQTPLINSDGTFRVTMTLDNSQNQPVGEFMLQLVAEDTVGSCEDHWLWIPAYLIDERENLGEQ